MTSFLDILNPSDNIVVIFGALSVTFVLLVRKIYFGSENIPTKQRGRRLSFDSFCMIEGVFPANANALPPIINVLLHFQESPSLDRVITTAYSLLKYDRFRSKATFDSRQKSWILKDVDVDIQSHIKSLEVDNEEQLLDEVNRIACKCDLDYTIEPAWRIYRITNRGTGTSGILVRIHHALGDGISLVGVMENLFFDTTNQPLRFTLPERSSSKTSRSRVNLWALCKSFINVISLAATPYDSNTPFTVKERKTLSMTPSSKIVLFPTLRLAFLKKVKNEAGGTLNDVMLAATAGMVRRLCLHRNGEVGAVRTRALIPVAFPRVPVVGPDPSANLKNYWVFVSAPLPVSIPDTLLRMEACKAAMVAIKQSPIAAVQCWVQKSIVPYLPRFVARQTVFDIFSRHSMVFSNVPGPQQTAVFAGEPMLGLQMIFPNLVNQVGILSYNGAVFMNMAVDEENVADANLLPTFFIDELRELAKSLGVACGDGDMLLPVSSGGLFRLTDEDEAVASTT